jgi:hypothetical protein
MRKPLATRFEEDVGQDSAAVMSLARQAGQGRPVGHG